MKEEEALERRSEHMDLINICSLLFDITHMKCTKFCDYSYHFCHCALLFYCSLVAKRQHL